MFRDGLSDGFERFSLIFAIFMSGFMKNIRMKSGTLFGIVIIHGIKLSENFRGPSESPSKTSIDFPIDFPTHQSMVKHLMFSN